MNPILLPALFLFVCTIVANAQERVTLNGYIRDAANGEELIGVTVYIPQVKAGTTSNSYGFYSITVPPGDYQVQFSYVGFRTLTLDLALTENVTRNIDLETAATYIQEIVVEDERIDANVVDVQMSRNTIDMNQV